MIKLDLFPFAALAAPLALGLALVAAPAPFASAQPLAHQETRCTDTSCADFRCSVDGCTRVSAWRTRNVAFDRDRSYYFDESADGRRLDRCDDGRCALLRCDADGKNCVPVMDGRPR